MIKDGITLDQVTKVVSERKPGLYPKGTPFENYDHSFVTGWIIPNWENIVKLVK